LVALCFLLASPEKQNIPIPSKQSEKKMQDFLKEKQHVLFHGCQDAQLNLELLRTSGEMRTD